MTASVNSAIYKLTSRRNTPSGLLSIYEYKVQMLGVRLLTNVPWRIDDLGAWLSEMQKVAESGVANQKYSDFTEKTTKTYGDVQECESSPVDAYDYICYKTIGTGSHPLHVLRAAIHVDRERFRQHIDKLKTPISQDTIPTTNCDTQEFEVELGKTIGSYYDLNEADNQEIR